MSGIKVKMSEKTKTIFLYSFLFVVILSRIILETAYFAQNYFFSYFVTIHHFCWYLFVFFYFSICCRYILGMKRESAKYLAVASPVIFIPIISAYLKNEKLQLAYLKGDIGDVLFNVSTLFKFHEKNSEFFPEMVILLIIFIAGSWFISKSVKRTVLNVLFGFYGAAIFAGLHLFGVYPRTKAYFKIHTVLRNHQLLALIYFSLAVTFFVIYSYPEIKKAFSKTKFKYIVLFVTGICLSILSSKYIFEFFYSKMPESADKFLMTTPFVILAVSLFPIFGKSSNSFVAGKFFPAVFSILSVLIIAGIYLQMK